jgi:hypothetical protein
MPPGDSVAERGGAFLRHFQDQTNELFSIGLGIFAVDPVRSELVGERLGAGFVPVEDRAAGAPLGEGPHGSLPEAGGAPGD